MAAMKFCAVIFLVYLAIGADARRLFSSWLSGYPKVWNFGWIKIDS